MEHDTDAARRKGRHNDVRPREPAVMPASAPDCNDAQGRAASPKPWMDDDDMGLTLFGRTDADNARQYDDGYDYGYDCDTGY